MVVHGWVTPDDWREGTSLYGELVDDPDVKAARLSRNHREGDGAARALGEIGRSARRHGWNVSAARRGSGDTACSKLRFQN